MIDDSYLSHESARGLFFSKCPAETPPDRKTAINRTGHSNVPALHCFVWPERHCTIQARRRPVRKIRDCGEQYSNSPLATTGNAAACISLRLRPRGRGHWTTEVTEGHTGHRGRAGNRSAHGPGGRAPPVLPEIAGVKSMPIRELRSTTETGSRSGRAGKRSREGGTRPRPDWLGAPISGGEDRSHR